jgi:transposase
MTKLANVSKMDHHIYVGIDVHKKSWSVCIRSKELEHKTFHMESNVEILHNYLQKHFKHFRVTCGYEACCMGFWIQKRLHDHGYECLVLNPADIPGSDKEEKRKSDNSDCRKIARELSNEHMKGIFIPSEEQIAFRSLFRKRNNVLKNLRRIKSNIRAQLLFMGIIVPEEYEHNTWNLKFQSWLKELKFEQAMARETLNSHLREFNFLHTEFLLLEKELRGYARKYYKNDYTRLRTIPGIGPLVSISLLAELGDIRRFKRVEELNSYIGLVPNIYQSAETEINRGMTNRAKRLLRSYLIESSWIAARMDPEMMKYYSERVKKMHPNKVIVKIARKLVNRLYYMVRYNRDYQINVSQE